MTQRERKEGCPFSIHKLFDDNFFELAVFLLVSGFLFDDLDTHDIQQEVFLWEIC